MLLDSEIDAWQKLSLPGKTHCMVYNLKNSILSMCIDITYCEHYAYSFVDYVEGNWPDCWPRIIKKITQKCTDYYTSRLDISDQLHTCI